MTNVTISMNVRIHQRVMLTAAVLILMDRIFALVTLVSRKNLLGTVLLPVSTSMNVSITKTLAISMHRVQILLAVTFVNVIMVSVVMASHVMMSTNVRPASIIVTKTPLVIIHSDHMNVNVMMGFPVMKFVNISDTYNT